MRHKIIAPVLALIRLVLGLVLISFGSIALAQSLAVLESPAAGSFQESGVNLIRGWVCQASRVEISIDNGPLLTAAYGTERSDTQSVCGDSNNGFGLTINWGTVGEGAHNLRALADGKEFANVDFVITTLGGSFLTKLIGEYTLKDFPTPGSSPKVQWSEPHQNFVLTKNQAVPANPDAPSNPRALLESPTQGSSESGVNLIRGWVCQASRVEISIDGGARLPTAYGTTRADTQATCGDSNNGFGLTFNWNEIGDGVHNLRAFADNVEFANVNFAVATLGGKFLTGLSSRQTLADFPKAGNTTTVTWSEPHQNFVIAKTTATEPKIGILSAITDRFNRFATTSVSTESADILGVAATKDNAGEATKINSLAWTDSNLGVQADVLLTTNGLPATYKDSGGIEARFSNFTATTTTVGFFDRNGNPQAEPVTVPINVGFLQSLQNVANRIAGNTQSAAANTDDSKQIYSPARAALADANTDRQPRASTSALRFSLSALLINAQWYGGLTTGEVLCAVRTASAQVGILSRIASLGCQSTLITSFLDRASTVRQSQATSFTDVVDPVAQQSLQFSADVAEAPCAANATSAECLVPVAIIVEAREETGTPIPPNNADGLPIPATPSDVSASDGDFADRTRITWSAATGATFYQVYREGLLLGSPTLTVFDDNSATPGTPYTYAVTACNSAGCSSTSIDTGFIQAPEVTVPVPSVVGQTQSAATSALTAAHLALGTVTIQAATEPTGIVLGQFPAGGSTAAPGTAVNLVVSSGPTTVPDVVGQSQSAAISAITAANLTVGTVTIQDNTAPAGTVLSQFPTANSAVAPGAVVNLVVSTGPIAISYAGSSELCYTATANFGANGVCHQCASGAASATLRNLGELTISSPFFIFNTDFDASGNCQSANLTLGSQLTHTTTASDGTFNYSYDIVYGGQTVVATVIMSGTYSSDMLISGSASYAGQSTHGPITIDVSEVITLQQYAGSLTAVNPAAALLKLAPVPGFPPATSYTLSPSK